MQLCSIREQATVEEPIRFHRFPVQNAKLSGNYLLLKCEDFATWIWLVRLKANVNKTKMEER